MRVWDPRRGVAAGSPPLPHEGPVVRVSFAPDGRRLLTVSREGVVRLWDLATESDEQPRLRHGPNAVNRVVFAGGKVVTVCDPNLVGLWTIDGEEPQALRLSRPDAIANEAWDAAFDANPVTREWADPERDRSRNHTHARKRIWDLLPGDHPASSLRLGPKESPERGARWAAISPDGKLAAVPQGAEAVQLYEVASGKPFAAPLPHPGHMYAGEFSPDGAAFVTAGSKHLSVWDVLPEPRLRREIGSGEFATQAAFTADGLRVVAVQTGGQLASRNRTGYFADDGPRTYFERFHKLTAGKAWAWGLADGQALFQPVVTGRARHLGFSPDGSLLAAGLEVGSRGRARIVSPDPGVKPVELHHSGAVHHVSFDADRGRIATASEDHTARVWDLKTGEPVTPYLRHDGAATRTVFSADGRFLAAVTANSHSSELPGQVKVWHVESGLPLTPPLGHLARATSAAFSPRFGDGDWQVATAGWDHTAVVWDFTPDTRPAEHLKRLAEVLSCSRFNSRTGDLSPLDGRAAREVWQALRSESPRDFAPTDRQVRAWHERQALEAEGEKNYPAAVVHLSQLIALRPDQANLWARRGVARANLEQWRAAEQDLSKALELGHDDWQTRARRGIARLHAGDVRASLDDLARASESADAAWEVGYYRGTALAELERWAEASGALTRSIGQGAIDPDVWVLDGLVRARNGDAQGYASRCRDLAGHLDDPRTDTVPSSVIRACCLDAAALNHVHQHFVNDARRRGYAVAGGYDQGYREALLRAARREAEQNPDDPDALSLLGKALFRCDRFEETVLNLEKAGATAENRLFLALALHKLDQTDRARKLLDQAREQIEQLRPGTAPCLKRLELRHLLGEAERAVAVSKKGARADAPPAAPPTRPDAATAASGEEPAEPPDDRPMQHPGLDWLKANLNADPDKLEAFLAALGKELDSAASQGSPYLLKVGSGRTKGNKPFLLCWHRDEHFAFELAEDQARQLGIARSKLTAQTTPGQSRAEKPIWVRLGTPKLDDPARLDSRKAISGEVPYEVVTPPGEQILLRLRFLTSPLVSHSKGVVVDKLTEPKGVIRFSAEPDWGRYFGPMLVIFELSRSSERSKEKPDVLSNPVGVILNFTYSADEAGL